MVLEGHSISYRKGLEEAGDSIRNPGTRAQTKAVSGAGIERRKVD